MLQQIINLILFRSLRAKRLAKKLCSSVESELAEEFLELLLKGMGLFICINKEFRRNIENFKGRYLFKSKDNQITVSASFTNSKMKVKEGVLKDTDIVVNFKNAAALRNFLLSPKPDILNSILNQDITLDGNLNYLYKFAYMAKLLQLTVAGKV